MKTMIKIIGQNEEEIAKLFVRKLDGDVKGLEEYIQREAFRRRRLTGYREREIVYLDYTEIFYIDSMEGRQTIHSVRGEFVSPKRLYELEEEMRMPMFRISKSVILNLEKVERYIPRANGVMEAKLTNGTSVYISRRYLKAVMERVKGEQ